MLSGNCRTLQRYGQMPMQSHLLRRTCVLARFQTTSPSNWDGATSLTIRIYHDTGSLSRSPIRPAWRLWNVFATPCLFTSPTLLGTRSRDARTLPSSGRCMDVCRPLCLPRQTPMYRYPHGPNPPLMSAHSNRTQTKTSWKPGDPMDALRNRTITNRIRSPRMARHGPAVSNSRHARQRPNALPA